MKRFKRIRDLRREQRILHARESELEKLIQHDWSDVREAMKIKNILKSRSRRGDAKQPQKKSSFAADLPVNLGLFACKIAKRAERKIETKLSEKIESVLSHIFSPKEF